MRQLVAKMNEAMMKCFKKTQLYKCLSRNIGDIFKSQRQLMRFLNTYNNLAITVEML